jgi:tRNA modification GTPase
METVVSVLTPPGKAALATIAVAGPRAQEAVRAIFCPLRGVALGESPEVGRFWLGRLGDTQSEEAVLAVRSVEPPLLELHVHGGHEVIRCVLEHFAARGVIPVSWQSMLERCEVDPLRPTAANVLAHTTTTRTAGIALDQYQAAFSAFQRQTEALMATGMYEHARKLVQEVLRYAEIGHHLTTPWRVVIAGAPNVGKSSLVNVLAGYQRSVVAPTPGTTRDVVTAQLAIDGWPVEVVDTAGLRVDGESLERLGIDQARAAAATADLVIWLVDASTEPVWPTPPMNVLPQLRTVVNKVDLPPMWDLDAEGAKLLRISASTGQGVSDLVAAIGSWLVSDPPPAGAAVPFTLELIERLSDVDRLLGGTPEASGNAALARLRG